MASGRPACMDTIVRIQPPPTAVAPERGSNTSPRSQSDGGSPFKAVLEGFGRELDRGQRLMQHVTRGASAMAPEQLLALQAGVYRYTEVVDLTTKLVDRTCTGLKTTLQSQ
jgi:hypothetical protein